MSSYERSLLHKTEGEKDRSIQIEITPRATPVQKKNYIYARILKMSLHERSLLHETERE
jgi:hypothetical protein